MKIAPDTTSKPEEGTTCSSGVCGMKLCSPCTMMKLVMVGVVIFASMKYFAW